ncbi:MAG: histidine--tRNA ligase [Spirochaetales bacterium]|nr:histidine--tRNA ligase [Spirochaetales bacterium]
MPDIIQPRVLKGFRDFLPRDEIARQNIESILARTIRSFGFVPIDTPVLEYAEILLGKGGGETDKQVYRFKDHGDRDVAMRYDLTVSFARYMAAHENEIPLPFRRFHLGKVWRGENTQRGRYREFKQCDFDIVGVDALNADIEIILLIKSCFEHLGAGEITIEISQRRIFNRFLERLECGGQAPEVLRTVDKLGKIGEEGVRECLEEFLPAQKACEIIDYTKMEGNYGETLRKIEEAAGGPDASTERMAEIGKQLDDLGIVCVRLNPSITRGLDYYTDIVYETLLDDLPGIGSVCSGGRYNNLASLYTKTELPGVGASIGIDRLAAALEEIGKLDSAAAAGPQIAILMLDDGLNVHYQRIAGRLREYGLDVEIMLEKKRLSAQFKTAERKGIPLAIICGEDEKARGTVNLRDLRTRLSYENLTLEASAEKALKLLGGGE